MRRLLQAVGFIVGALVAVIGVELVMLSRREYLPSDPGYVVDMRVEPRGGASGEPVRLAVLGDSTVVGVGSPTEAESLPVLIAQRVADATGRPVEVTGFGDSGARTATLTADQLPRVGGGFDVLVLVIGSNDATHATLRGARTGRRICAPAQNLRRFAAIARPRWAIGAGSPAPRGVQPGRPPWIAAAADASARSTIGGRCD